MPSATHSSVGIANLPNQRHKIVSRQGANFNLMVVGESGLGKTTFLNTLFSSTVKDSINNTNRWNTQLKRTVAVEVTRLDVEEKGNASSPHAFFSWVSLHSCATLCWSFLFERITGFDIHLDVVNASRLQVSITDAIDVHWTRWTKNSFCSLAKSVAAVERILCGLVLLSQVFMRVNRICSSEC